MGRALHAPFPQIWTLPREFLEARLGFEDGSTP